MRLVGGGGTPLSCFAALFLIRDRGRKSLAQRGQLKKKFETAIAAAAERICNFVAQLLECNVALCISFQFMYYKDSCIMPFTAFTILGAMYI